MRADQMQAPEPDNAERIARGATVLEAYEAIDGADADCPHDAIADILHKIHADGGDTEAAIRMAVANFEAERDGEE